MASIYSAPRHNPEADLKGGKGLKFWLVFPPLCISTLFFALESTVTSTSLPNIVADLNAGDAYVWFLNAYLLTSTAFVPICGQIAIVFGRKWPMLLSVAIFTLGSGISGGADSTGGLVAGRVIQGIGGAGINSLPALIISDLVPVRDRGKYDGILLATLGVGLAVGPTIGGLIAESGHWRWIFWLNLPLGAVVFVLQCLFLPSTYRKDSSLKSMGQMDWIGNGLLVGCMVSILLALSWVDIRYSWTSWHILVPLIAGFVGLFAFSLFESSAVCTVPTIPRRLFVNRTSTILYINSFLVSAIIFWRIYFLPLYFQSVLTLSPGRAGVLLLPTLLTAIPAAIVSGVALSRWGRYKHIHVLGSGLMTLASGLYIHFGSHTSLAEIIICQIIGGFGTGIQLTTYLPALQGSLPESDVTAATATWGYLRGFGGVWGIAIPAAIFNHRFAHLIQSIGNETVREAVGGANAYAHVSSAYINSLPDDIRGLVVGAYAGTMKSVWMVCTAFCAVVFVLTWFEREIVLRTTM